MVIVKAVVFLGTALFSINTFANGLCAFSKMGGGVPYQTAPQIAISDVQNVLDVLEIQGQLPVYLGPVQNAAAFPATFNSAAHIVYNPHFLNSLFEQNRYAALSVLAHEVGHHVDNSRFSSNSWSRELGADFVAGCALSRMNVSFNDATYALKTMFDVYGSPSHPDTPKRLNAMKSGYQQCGN